VAHVGAPPVLTPGRHDRFEAAPLRSRPRRRLVPAIPREGMFKKMQGRETE